jgi:hypothetical protein
MILAVILSGSLYLAKDCGRGTRVYSKLIELDGNFRWLKSKQLQGFQQNGMKGSYV